MAYYENAYLGSLGIPEITIPMLLPSKMLVVILMSWFDTFNVWGLDVKMGLLMLMEFGKNNLLASEGLFSSFVEAIVFDNTSLPGTIAINSYSVQLLINLVTNYLSRKLEQFYELFFFILVNNPFLSNNAKIFR